MTRIFTYGLIFSFGSALHAQSINVHGKVSNAAGQPVANAVVELAQQKIKDTTGADGMYSITSPGVAIRSLASTLAEGMRLENGTLELTVRKAAPMKIEVFDVNGNLLKKEFTPKA